MATSVLTKTLEHNRQTIRVIPESVSYTYIEHQPQIPIKRILLTVSQKERK